MKMPIERWGQIEYPTPRFPAHLGFVIHWLLVIPVSLLKDVTLREGMLITDFFQENLGWLHTH